MSRDRIQISGALVQCFVRWNIISLCQILLYQSNLENICLSKTTCFSADIVKRWMVTPLSTTRKAAIPASPLGRSNWLILCRKTSVSRFEFSNGCHFVREASGFGHFWLLLKLMYLKVKLCGVYFSRVV